ncbi:MAG: twin-arginine translocase subunit TatC [Candidatus Margulisbacteria bacterium]|nr:twin-arginine translocase subunit TatC [Candidatus Margulisiibacteriota bacterium]
MLLLLLIFLAGLFAAGFYFAVHILRWLVAYLAAGYGVNIAILSPMEAIISIMQLALLLTLIVCVPVIILLFINYVRPALYENERRILVYVPVGLALGCAGSLFGWYLSLHIFLPYFEKFSRLLGVQNVWTLEHLTGFVIGNLFIFFLVFQIPLIIISLHALGLLKTGDMALLRKVVLVAALVIGATVTPPDVASQLLVALPFYLLFELSIQYCRFKEKRQKKKLPGKVAHW